MGKKLVIIGADFSANGIRTGNIVNVEMKDGGTNPVKVYFMPTPFTSVENVNTPLTLPEDAVENSISASADIPINGSYATIHLGLDSVNRDSVNIRSLSINYNNEISDTLGAFEAIYADEVDLRGMKFASGVNAMRMFSFCDILDLKMPDMIISSTRLMFYNYSNTRFIDNFDCNWIKKITDDLTGMFQYFKAKSLDVSGIDVSTATIFNSLFLYSTLEEIDLSTWHMDSLEWCSGMFEGCSNLKTVHLDNWSVSNISISARYDNMFTDCNALTTVYVTNCTSGVKTWLIARLNENTAGGSSNWVESTVGGKAALVRGA